MNLVVTERSCWPSSRVKVRRLSPTFPATKARRDSARIALAMSELCKVAPDGGAYVAESSYSNPTGSAPVGEAWSDGGFDRLA